MIKKSPLETQVVYIQTQKMVRLLVFPISFIVGKIFSFTQFM